MKRFYATALFCTVAFAQPAFEVASIKPLPSQASTERKRVLMDATQVDLGNVTAASLIQLAYRVDWDHFSGPDWTNQQRYDVHATLPPGSSKAMIPEMMQELLAKRFGLAIHHDPRPSDVYALTVAKDGPKFHQSAPADPAMPGCQGALKKVCHKSTIDDLINILMLPFHAGMGAGYAVDRLIIDETGLTGLYDFSFEYGRSGEADPGSTAFDVAKTLGLKLVPSKHTYDFIVVDHIDRIPTGN